MKDLEAPPASRRGGLGSWQFPQKTEGIRLDLGRPRYTLPSELDAGFHPRLGYGYLEVARRNDSETLPV